jgi:NADPH2:quinone reductase
MAPLTCSPQRVRETKELTGARRRRSTIQWARCIDESVRSSASKVGFHQRTVSDRERNMPPIKGFGRGQKAVNTGGNTGTRANIRTIDAWAAEGRIRPHVSASFPLERALEAMALLQTRQVIGKAVLTP